MLTKVTPGCRTSTDYKVFLYWCCASFTARALMLSCTVTSRWSCFLTSAHQPNDCESKSVRKSLYICWFHTPCWMIIVYNHGAAVVMYCGWDPDPLKHPLTPREGGQTGWQTVMLTSPHLYIYLFMYLFLGPLYGFIGRTDMTGNRMSESNRTGRSCCTWDACATNWAKQHPDFRFPTSFQRQKLNDTIVMKTKTCELNSCTLNHVTLSC